jgi:hypothetical protein
MASRRTTTRGVLTILLAALAEELTGSLLGRSVVVLTEPVPTSLDAETAKDGVFAVARIVLRAP